MCTVPPLPPIGPQWTQDTPLAWAIAATIPALPVLGWVGAAFLLGGQAMLPRIRGVGWPLLVLTCLCLVAGIGLLIFVVAPSTDALDAWASQLLLGDCPPATWRPMLDGWHAELDRLETVAGLLFGVGYLLLILLLWISTPVKRLGTRGVGPGSPASR